MHKMLNSFILLKLHNIVYSFPCKEHGTIWPNRNGLKLKKTFSAKYTQSVVMYFWKFNNNKEQR